MQRTWLLCLAVKTKPQSEPVSEKPKSVKKAPTGGSFDVGALRRMWPDVIEDVKKRRRLTWSLLSSSAQVLAVDDAAITIAIMNSGAKDSFSRSGSDEILRQAFIDVVGIDRKIEAVVDPGAASTPTSNDEAHDDEELLSGAALLARELGAQVISEKPKNA